jgi:hypothetical protein
VVGFGIGVKRMESEEKQGSNEDHQGFHCSLPAPAFVALGLGVGELLRWWHTI